MEELIPSVGQHASVSGNSKAPFETVFEVSTVSQADKPLPEIPYYEAVETLLKKPPLQWWEENPEADINVEEDKKSALEQSKKIIESCSQYRGRLVASVQLHPLITAIHKAFNDHRPLCLSPDMIWLLICQGLASHINANAEQLRSKFVKHQGKVRLEVRRDDFVKGTPENPWEEVIEEFSETIRQHIGEATHNLLIPAFSTTGLVERAATEIVLLDAMRSYFDYEVCTMCGIPKIKLEGTVTDWQQLLQRTIELSDFELQWWIQPLIPILEQFIQAAQNKPDQRFWQSMYKLSDDSGGPYITGWITAFFPYLKDRQTDKITQQNQWLAAGGSDLQALLYSDEQSSDPFQFFFGLTTELFPSGLAKAPFCWRFYETSYNMEFLGGFVGVRQDPNTLFLRPEIGWVIREVATP
jgi:hypothetical protein